jgi:hypothetical protein
MRRVLTGVRAAALVGAALFLCAAQPQLDPAFGANDVHTVFYIGKSDDESRVDYGLRLDEHCRPKGDEALFPYWREFESGVFARTHSSTWFDRLGYGVAKQRLVRRSDDGAEMVVRIKPVEREVMIVTSRGADGKCQALARTTIAGIQGAEFSNGFVKLKSKFSVLYVELRGRNPTTSADVAERLSP